jgi:hypothetical protein
MARAAALLLCVALALAACCAEAQSPQAGAADCLNSSGGASAVCDDATEEFCCQAPGGGGFQALAVPVFPVLLPQLRASSFCVNARQAAAAAQAMMRFSLRVLLGFAAWVQAGALADAHVRSCSQRGAGVRGARLHPQGQRSADLQVEA